MKPIFVALCIFLHLFNGRLTSEVGNAHHIHVHEESDTKHYSTRSVTSNQVFNFSIPENPSERCLKVEMAFSVDIDYLTVDNKTASNHIDFSGYNQFWGECNATINTLSIKWRNDWLITFNFTRVGKAYHLAGVSLDYSVDSRQFPNVTDQELGVKHVQASNIGIFSTDIGNSFKCQSDTRIKLNDKKVVLTIRKYHGQPFMSGEPGKPREFGTAIECIEDKFNANKLVPIIVGSVLAALVLVILITFIVGRRKHQSSPGYQQV